MQFRQFLEALESTIDNLWNAFEEEAKQSKLRPEKVAIIADAYDEEGNPIAQGLRWLTQNQKMPFYPTRLKNNPMFTWLSSSSYKDIGFSVIPPKLMALIATEPDADVLRSGEGIVDNSSDPIYIMVVRFQTLKQAYLALAKHAPF